MMTLTKKLLEIQKVVDYFKKDKSGYKYKYVLGSTILAKIKHKKDELGLLLYPEISADGKITQIDKEIREDGKITQIDKIFIFSGSGFMTWEDSEGEIKRIPTYFTGKQNDPSKAFGSALTYTERYFLLKFFGIPTDEIDPDAFQEKTKEPVSEKIICAQNDVVEVLREMYRTKLDGFNVITRVQNSLQKHLGLKINSMKEISIAVKKIEDFKKLDDYSIMLIEKIQKSVEEKEKKENEEF